MNKHGAANLDVEVEKPISPGRSPKGFSKRFWGAVLGLTLSFGIGVSIMGCGDTASESASASSSEGTMRVLSEPPRAKAKPKLPDASIWETPLEDEELERGRLVWSGTCIQCHSIGLGGAPLIGNRTLWAPRIDQGIEVLVSHAQNGFYGDVGEMPARGGNEELSDAEVEAAVRFMVSRAE